VTSALVCVLCLPLAFAAPPPRSSGDDGAAGPRLHLLSEGRSGFGAPPGGFPSDGPSTTALGWTGAELLFGAGGATVAALRGYKGGRIALDLGLSVGLGGLLSVSMALAGAVLGLFDGKTGNLFDACATFLNALLLVAIGFAVGLVVAPPLGLIAAEALQGHSPGVGGWVVAQGGTALGVAFAGVALALSDDDRGAGFLPVFAAPVAAAGGALGLYSLFRR
jgi:hypothetical protein